MCNGWTSNWWKHSALGCKYCVGLASWIMRGGDMGLEWEETCRLRTQQQEGKTYESLQYFTWNIEISGVNVLLYGKESYLRHFCPFQVQKESTITPCRADVATFRVGIAFLRPCRFARLKSFQECLKALCFFSGWKQYSTFWQGYEKLLPVVFRICTIVLLRPQ